MTYYIENIALEEGTQEPNLLKSIERLGISAKFGLRLSLKSDQSQTEQPPVTYKIFGRAWSSRCAASREFFFGNTLCTLGTVVYLVLSLAW